MTLQIGDFVSWDENYKKNEFGIITGFGLDRSTHGDEEGVFIDHLDEDGCRYPVHIAYSEGIIIYNEDDFQPRHHAALLGVTPKCREQ